MNTLLNQDDLSTIKEESPRSINSLDNNNEIIYDSIFLQNSNQVSNSLNVTQNVLESNLEKDNKNVLENKNEINELRKSSNDDINSETYESIILNREYKYIKDENYQKLYECVEILLKSENLKNDFFRIIPLLMLEVNLYNFSLKGDIKKQIVCEFLNYILEDNESPFYKLLDIDYNTRELLIIICPVMIDIVYNISKYGINNKKYKKYDTINDNELINLMIENTKDLHFDSKNLTKPQLISKMCALIIGLISFLETNNIKKDDIILIVLEKFIDDKILLKYSNQIVNLIYNLIIGNLQIFKMSKCECNCFSYFF
jgi:hypothetical protein